MHRHLFKYFKSTNEKIIIELSFAHGDQFKHYLPAPNKRINITVFPIEDLNADIPLQQVPESFYILANADIPEYALSYKISINEETKSVTAILEDRPSMGSNLLSEEEEIGLEVLCCE